MKIRIGIGDAVVDRMVRSIILWGRVGIARCLIVGSRHMLDVMGQLRGLLFVVVDALQHGKGVGGCCVINILNICILKMVWFYLHIANIMKEIKEKMDLLLLVLTKEQSVVKEVEKNAECSISSSFSL